ncbi:hypothetical protein BDY19DRAFT_927076 [Irpex rosettiformis]|uniref:Uncharacterized protein n=1 Tax=Irpex rosettiformis TaxID=378272 RepID=A0ACB8UC22_9APHY|nr:hypothetical protein BDY19DRAFT_927076 [Irpex rosettiformis]
MPPVKIERDHERKRPRCQKCGNFMAGHKRRNGTIVCPLEQECDPFPVDEPTLISSGPSCSNIPLRREVAVPVLEKLKAGQVYRYRNPNWEDETVLSIPYVSRPTPRHSGSPDSWVSTEPADDIPSMRTYVKQERQLSAVHESDEIEFMMVRPPSVAPSASPVESSSASASTRLRRSFSSILNNSVPILSMFSAQREDVTKITQTARRNGLHTGVMRPPESPIEVKDEDDYDPPPKQRKPLWVIVGKDPMAVEHLLDLQEKDELARIDPTPLSSLSSTPLHIAASSAQTQKPHQFSTPGLVTLVVFIVIFVNALGILALSFL